MGNIHGKADTLIENTGGRLALTVNEAAAALGLSSKYIYKLVYLRRIPHVKLGRSVRFLPEDLQAWLKKRRATYVS